MSHPRAAKRGLRTGGLAALALLTGLSACATRPNAVPMAAAPATMLTGTILSSRLVMLQIAGAEGGVLGALGAPASAGETLAPATEFIVRETGGTIISVMQPQPTSLRPGERVEILRGLTTRLAPLPPSPST